MLSALVALFSITSTPPPNRPEISFGEILDQLSSSMGTKIHCAENLRNNLVYAYWPTMDTGKVLSGLLYCLDLKAEVGADGALLISQAQTPDNVQYESRLLAATKDDIARSHRWITQPSDVLKRQLHELNLAAFAPSGKNKDAVFAAAKDARFLKQLDGNVPLLKVLMAHCAPIYRSAFSGTWNPQPSINVPKGEQAALLQWFPSPERGFNIPQSPVMDIYCSQANENRRATWYLCCYDGSSTISAPWEVEDVSVDGLTATILPPDVANRVIQGTRPCNPATGLFGMSSFPDIAKQANLATASWVPRRPLFTDEALRGATIKLKDVPQYIGNLQKLRRVPLVGLSERDG